MSQEDRAQELELLEWERNNKVRTQKTYSPHEAGYGPEVCDECEEPMPALRRADGRRRCTVCQTHHERRY
jgi:RNA polymerase-binding transcription factor DksA